ncbi:MAG: sterol desaturase family protein [Polyangiaceae bacterium]
MAERPMTPPARATTTRMFESDFIEWFSRIHPATPFVAWLPVIGFLIYRTVLAGSVPLPAAVGLFVAGIFIWSIAEYVLHRWVFHWVNDTSWGRRIHFLLHGVHHDFPNDKDRLVMPLGASIPMAMIFFFVFRLVLGATRVEPFFAGFILGYLAYDGTHYAIHHFKQTTRVGKWLRRHHMLHHHADHHGGFGVSSPLWDYVFRTIPEPKRRSRAASPADANG